MTAAELPPWAEPHYGTEVGTPPEPAAVAPDGAPTLKATTVTTPLGDEADALTFNVARDGSNAAPILEFRSFARLAGDVDARGPRRWLARGIWPSGDYGVLAAEPKAGKTWTALDLAVSVATGTPWLGTVEVDDPGPVIVFAGEGGEGNVVRRLRAIACGRTIDPDGMPVSICVRAPRLTDAQHVEALATAVAQVRPKLVVLDPLYLAAGGAKGSDLYAMGALLEGPQRACQANGAALLVVTHYNRSRDLKGAARITGAGPAEWGRVLLSCGVISRSTNPDTKATTVLVELEVTGGEVPDQRLKVIRTIASANPDDLDAALDYTVRVEEAGNDTTALAGPGTDHLAPAERKILAALSTFTEPKTRNQVVDQVKIDNGHGLERETASRCLNKLLKLGLADHLEAEPWGEKRWFATTEKGV